MKPASFMCVVAAAALAVVAAGNSPYCTPKDACWPTAEEWAQLNTTVDGRLIAVQPEAAVCFTQGGASAACEVVRANWTNPYWRAAQPGAMQAPNWEEDASGDSCFNPSQPCAQGNIPPFAVAVRQAQDISAALQFAAAHKLKVVVKSTGHEFQGRSTAPNALMIWMHEFTGVQMSDSFSACSGHAAVPAVTVTGGTPWGTVYTTIGPQWGVVGGSARTVCASGGYTLCGGHSFMSPAYGLAVDNVLQFQVVLANGTFVTASACSFPDLFWALRGGGGSSFGVVTSTTYKMHATPAGGVTGLYVVIDFLQGASSLSTFLDAYFAAAPSMTSIDSSGVVAAGYTFASASQFTGVLVFNGTQAQAELNLMQLSTAIGQNPQHFKIATYTFFPAASMNAWHDVVDKGDNTGQSLTLSSRLVTRETCTNATQRAALVSSLTAIGQETTILGHLVAGGAVAALDLDSSQTSVTPVWRRAVGHYAAPIGWPLNATAAVVQASFAQSLRWTNMLMDAIPNSGAYTCESDFNQPNWQDTFWGAQNYARLQQIKAAYDPDNVFNCHHCVELP